MNNHLHRSRDDRMLAGVAGGLAELWDADPSLVRILWALLVILTGGIALVVYIVMAIVVPEEDDVVAWAGTQSTTQPDASTPPVGAPGQPAVDWQQRRNEARAEARAARREARVARRAARGNDHSGGIIVGVLFVLLGTWFLVREYLPTIDWDWFWPLALVGFGILVLALAVRPRSHGPGEGGAFGAGGAGS